MYIFRLSKIGFAVLALLLIISEIRKDDERKELRFAVASYLLAHLLIYMQIYPFRG